MQSSNVQQGFSSSDNHPDMSTILITQQVMRRIDNIIQDLTYVRPQIAELANVLDEISVLMSSHRPQVHADASSSSSSSWLWWSICVIFGGVRTMFGWAIHVVGAYVPYGQQIEKIFLEYDMVRIRELLMMFIHEI